MKVLIATEKPFAPAAVQGITNELKGAGHEVFLLEKYTEKSQLLDAVKDADAMIVRSDKITPEVLDAARQLKIVVRAGAGYDSIDTAYAKEKGVVVENTPGQNSNAVAELVFGMLVYAVRNFYNGKSGTELMGKKLGILHALPRASVWKFMHTMHSVRLRLSKQPGYMQSSHRTSCSRPAMFFHSTSLQRHRP